MRRVLLATLLLAGAARAAEKVAPPQLSAPDSWRPRTAATLRVLNKIDASLHEITLHVGSSATEQSLTIALKACVVRPPDLPADAAARLVITDSRPDAPGFDGWILLAEPGISLFEHPVYDVQLVGCS